MLAVMAAMGIGTYKFAMFSERAVATRRRCRRYEEDEIVDIIRGAGDEALTEDIRRLYGHDWRKPGE